MLGLRGGRKLRELIKQKKIKGIKQDLGDHNQIQDKGNQEITVRFRRREYIKEIN